jgi:hypothetical protein
MEGKNIQNDLYVNVKKPLELRRSILEASKDVLFTLQKIEHIRQIRKQKTDLIQQLKVQIGEINLLASKLSEHLPDYTFAPKMNEELLKIRAKERKEELHEESKKAKKDKKGKKEKKEKIKNNKKGKQPEEEDANESRKLELQLNKVAGKLKKLKR